MSASSFARDVRKEIVLQLTCGGSFHATDIDSKLRVCVPDKMFENWIIADVEGIKTATHLISAKATQRNFEGKNGSRELSAIMVTPYKKTSHAEDLFARVRFEIAENQSASFALFLSAISS